MGWICHGTCVGWCQDGASYVWDLKNILFQHLSPWQSAAIGITMGFPRKKTAHLGLLPFMETPIWISVAIMKVLIMGDHTPEEARQLDQSTLKPHMGMDQNLMLYTAYHILGKWISIIFS